MGFICTQYLCSCILGENEGVDMTNGHHVQNGTPVLFESPCHQTAEVETQQRKGVFRGRGEPLNGNGQLQRKGTRNEQAQWLWSSTMRVGMEHLRGVSTTLGTSELLKGGAKHYSLMNCQRNCLTQNFVLCQQVKINKTLLASVSGFKVNGNIFIF